LDSKYKKLKLRVVNSIALSDPVKFESDLRASVLSFARLPVGHPLDFICLAPCGGLDSVIEESFSELITLSSSDEET